MAEQIKFAGGQGGFTIEIHGYERPGAGDQDDANWLKCELSIKAGPFSGKFKCAFTTYDIIALAERLRSALAASGTVIFQSTEGDIDLDIALDKRGGAVIKGRANARGLPETSLQFRFDSDQSYLAQTLGQVDAVLRRFPAQQAQ